jgi:hypothetical protein
MNLNPERTKTSKAGFLGGRVGSQGFKNMNEF